MVLRSYYRIVMFGNRVPIGAFDGTPPYIYSIKPGGVGGYIDSNGIYIAPYRAGSDTIIAEDSQGEKAELIIGVGTVMHIIADIIDKQLNLDPGQVLIENQKFNIPNDSRLYVSVKTLTSRAFANRSSFDQNANEGQSVNMFAAVEVAIYSRSTEAMSRKEQVVMALNSTYAKQQQQLNGFMIGTLGSLVPLNLIDGAAIPYFYNLSFNVQYAVNSERAVDYFDAYELDEPITNP